MMSVEKEEEIDMVDGNFERGAPSAAATPPPAEPVSGPTASSPADIEQPQTPEELKQARDDSWARGEVPDEILKDAKGGLPEDTVHSLKLRRPRAGYSDKDGFVSAALNLKRLRENKPSLYQEAVDHGLISIKKGVEHVDIYEEFGGEDEYKKFVADEASKTDERTIRHDQSREGHIGRGFVREEHVTAEMIAHAYESWKAQKKLQEIIQKRNAVPATEIASAASQQGATAADSQPVDQSANQQLAGAEGQRQIDDELAAQFEEAKKAAEAAAKKVANDKEELKKIRQENKVISDEEAFHILKAIEIHSKTEEELREKLKTATAEEKVGLEKQLLKVRRQKAEVMLTAIGYDSQEASIILSGNADTDLAVFLKLAKHTSLSKEQNSENITELNRVVKMELLQSIADLLNKNKLEGEKQTWEQVRVIKAGEELRAAMKALGFDVETQDRKVKELVESANSPERNLNVSEEDSLHTMIESLVSGKPSAEMEKDAKSWFKKMEEEFREAGGKVEDFPKWLDKKIKETFHPDLAESIGLFFTMLLAEYLDVGAFMEMLLVGGDHFSSLAHDLGYKSKEQLLKEGKHPIDEHDVDAFIRKNDAKSANARELLCVGLEDIIPKEVVEEYFHNPSPSAVLKDESFSKILAKAFSKEYHEKFSVNLLKALGYTEKAQENSSITLTNTAMTFIMSLPEVAKKGNWTDSGESGGEKKATEKAVETVSDSKDQPAAQPSGDAQAEQQVTNQTQPAIKVET